MSLRLLFLTALLGFASACAAADRPPVEAGAAPPAQTSEAPKPESVRADLAGEIMDMDRTGDEARAALSYGPAEGPEFLEHAARADSVTREHTARLGEIVRAHGWPTEEMVGRDASRAALFMAIRAAHDAAFQDEALAALRAAHTAGEADGESLAMLTDRVRLSRGEPQLFGTQLILGDTDVTLQPIEDEENVDARRAELGMMPLGEYLALVRSMFEMRDQ